MKKFTLIAIGDCFDYQGKRYSKTGPLTATALDDSGQRMIPRSALVQPLSDATAASKVEADTPATLDAETTLAAFEKYHAGCLEWLHMAEQELSEETAQQIRTALEAAHQRFVQDLRPN